MNTENERCNGLDHEPSCTTWPPPWLTEEPLSEPLPPLVATEPEFPDPPRVHSPGKPWPVELVKDWLADTETEYVAPSEWFKKRNRQPS